jgi:pre-rRNA-processing protein IPI3
MRCAAPEPMGTVAASPDGTLVAAGGLSGRLYVWDAASGDLLRSWTGHYKAVSALAFSPCGSVLASGGGDGIVHCWDVAQAIDVAALSDLSAMPRPHPSWTEHSLAITSLAWGPAAGGCGGLASKLVSASADRSVRIWDVAVGRCLLALSFPSPVNRALVDPWEAAVYAACEDGGVYTAALHASALAQRGAPGGGGGSGAGAAAAATGLSSGRGSSSSAGLLASSAGPSASSAAIGFAAGAASVAFVGHAGPVHDIALTADGGRLLSAGQDGLVRVWDTASRQQVGAFDTARAVAAAGGSGGASSSTAGGGAAAAAAAGSAAGAGAAVVALLLARYDRVAAPGAGMGALAGRGSGSTSAGGSAAAGARSRQPAAAAAGSSSLLPSGRGGGGAGGVAAPDNVYAAAAGAGVGCASIAPLRKFARPLPPDAHGSSTGAGDGELLLRLRPCVRDSHPSSSFGLAGGEASSAAASGSAGAAGGDGLLSSTHRFRGATDPLAAAALGLQSLAGLLSAASAVHAAGAASTPSGVCAADDFSAPPGAAAAATFAASAAFRNAASEAASAASAAAEVTALRERVAALEAEGQRWRAVNNKLLERLGGAAQQGQQGPASATAAAPTPAAAGTAPSQTGVGSKRSR